MTFRNCGRPFQLLRDGELPVMAGNPFVISQRRHAPFRDSAHVAQVGEENSGPCAIQRPCLIIRARRSRFLEFRHALHFHLAFGHGKKQLLRILRRIHRSAACIPRARRPGLCHRSDKESADPCPTLPSLRRSAGRETLRIENRAHLVFNPRHFAQAELMHLIGLESGRGVLAQHVSVERFAVRQFPNAVIRRCLGEERREIGDQFLIRRINLVCHRRFHAGLIIGALRVG